MKKGKDLAKLVEAGLELAQKSKQELTKKLTEEFRDDYDFDNEDSISFLVEGVYSFLDFPPFTNELLLISKKIIRDELAKIIDFSTNLLDSLEKAPIPVRALIGILFPDDIYSSKMDVLADRVSIEKRNLIKNYDKISKDENFHDDLATIGPSLFSDIFGKLENDLYLLIKSASFVLDEIKTKRDGRPPTAKLRAKFIRHLGQRFDILVYKNYEEEKEQGVDQTKHFGKERVKFVEIVLKHFRIPYGDKEVIFKILGRSCNPEQSYFATAKVAEKICKNMEDPRNDPIKNPKARVIMP